MCGEQYVFGKEGEEEEVEVKDGEDEDVETAQVGVLLPVERHLIRTLRLIKVEIVVREICHAPLCVFVCL